MKGRKGYVKLSVIFLMSFALFALLFTLPEPVSAACSDSDPNCGPELRYALSVSKAGFGPGIG